ncbi:hypothetical protein Tco_0015145 [Tanacetum coccineum]
MCCDDAIHITPHVSTLAGVTCEKVINREVLVALKGKLYFVSFIINPEEDDIEPSVVFRRSFLRLTKAIVGFRSGILTIYPDLITFNSDSDDELDAILASINVDDLPPLDITDIPPFVLDSVLLHKLKLDGEFKREEEMVGDELIRGSNSMGAEFKAAFPRNCVVYAFGISLSCSYSGNAQDEVRGY